MSACFELWDAKSRNLVAEFDRLDEAVIAVRGFVERNGAPALDGLSLDAVSEDGEVRITLSQDGQLLDLVSATAGTAR